MEGDASQLCDATQSFSGDLPTCSLIDVTQDDSNTQEVTVQVEKSGGFDLSGVAILRALPPSTCCIILSIFRSWDAPYVHPHHRLPVVVVGCSRCCARLPLLPLLVARTPHHSPAIE